MERYNLELKREVKDANQDCVIFVSKQRGRRLVFPIDTPVEDYPKFKALGFKIFRCTECKSENCPGTCEGEVINEQIKDKYTSKEDKKEAEILAQYEDDKTIEELMEEEGLDIELGQEYADLKQEVEDKVEGEFLVDVIDYEKYSLKELRAMFPDIKDTSKLGFINKIPK